MIDIQDWPEFDRKKLFNYLRWNSYLSEHYKLFYVATPKVACTSLKWWFAELEGHSQVLREMTDSTETDPDLVIHDTYHTVAPQVTGLMPEALSDVLTSNSIFRFALVRNPYKRIFSSWQSKLLLREPLQSTPYRNCEFFKMPIQNAADISNAFESFLEFLSNYEAPSFRDPHWTSQSTLLRPDLISYTSLTQIENVTELRIALATHLGEGRFIDPFTFRRVNESLIPYSPQFYSGRSIDLINSLYGADFDVFSYPRILPPEKDVFTTEQLSVALQGIKLIRGRNQRLSEIRNSLSKTNAWLTSQGDAWESKAKSLDARVGQLIAYIDEQTKANAWLASQRDAWESKAKALDTRVSELTAKLEALEKKIQSP
jgi:hypothetical protein